MERKIGEIFEFGGEWYQCVNYGFSCADCDINGDCSDACVGSCSSCLRKDGKQVRFKKLEKIGEPHFIEDEIFEGGKVYVQNFKVYKDFEGHKPICNDYIIYDWDKKIISIEIKQNKKEDMEIDKVVMNIDDKDYLLDRLEAILHDTHCQQYKDEVCEALSKYIVTETASGLKPFDLNSAKAGKPVCTRDGRKARIICFDRDWDANIVALVEGPLGEEVHYYWSNGKVDFDEQNDDDLMMLPEKKEGWVNVYSNCLGGPYESKECALKQKK